MEKKVDIIIPTYKPDQKFFVILDKLLSQTVPVSQIIIMNTEEKYFNQLVYGKRFEDKYKNVKVYHISKYEFDHAATRSLAVRKSTADYFVMMTMDAVPKDEYMLENLLKPLLNDENVAVSYARQLPNEDAGVLEKRTRQFNYPDKPRKKTIDDLPGLGIKTYFCSDVCAAYNRKTFESLGGYVERAIFNEDMIYAAKALKNGYAVYYAADSCVYHSHNYSGKQQFHRNFDLGVSQSQNPDVFENVPSESEGIKMVKNTCAYLIKSGHKIEIIRLFWQSFCKYAGFRLGKGYKKLSKKMILFCTSNPVYWKK